MIHTRLQTQKCESQLLKVKDKDVLEKYNNPTLFQFFPAINTQILIVGKPRWDENKINTKIKSNLAGGQAKVLKMKTKLIQKLN